MSLTAQEIQLISDSGIFDAEWYSKKYPDVGLVGLDPLEHFVRIGIHAGREPGPLFDSKHYRRQLEQFDSGRNAGIPLCDYLEQGWREGINPNPFFDVSFYLEQSPDVANAGMEPLGHFIRFGSFEKRNPHPIFDIAFYLGKNPDVAHSGVGPLQHFILNGLHEGREPNADFNPKEYLALNPDVARANLPAALHYATHGYRENRMINAARRSFGHFSHRPLVSIIVVSYNSSKDLQVLLPSIANQTYQDFELFLVENGGDNSRDIVQQYFNNFKYIHGQGNIGFAAANNLAYEQSKGELIALINPDTRLENSCIEELVDSLRLDAEAAATIPKIRFLTKFVDITFSSSGEFNLNPKEIEKQLNYKKLFILKGAQHSPNLVAGSMGNSISLRLPIDESNVKIGLNCNYEQEITITEGDNTWVSEVSQAGIHEIAISLTLCKQKNSNWIINNAGSGIKSDGPYDIGIGEYDNGQYDSKAYVQAMCGCALIIRRAAIIGRNIFIPQFYAYFEDSELSAWIQDKGYKILYNPKSIVFHKHSASSSEGSILWNTLVSRGKNLYLATRNPQALDIQSRICLNSYSAEIPREIKNILEKYDAEFLKNIKNPASRNKTSVGIYNSYWNTFGGGEKHALCFASSLQGDCDVYLIGESDFDIEKLSRYFNIDLSKCLKLVEPQFNKASTRQYDVLINSTFHSNLDSEAKKSYYIVSFPHKHLPKDLLRKYYFLYNSEYTERWSKTYWGTPEGCVILPIMGISVPETLELKKEKIILSVGRFTPHGHCKNHGDILDAFCQAFSNLGRLTDWKLVLAGSYDNSNEHERRYLNNLNSNRKGYPIEIYPNLKNDVLNNLFQTASIYVHATGMGKDSEYEPELHEHFGITCFEAIKNRCFPLVYRSGGPAEQLKWAKVGSTYDDKEDLTRLIADTVQKIEENNQLISDCYQKYDSVNNIIEENRLLYNKILSEIIKVKDL
jgi:GT2 family glycosyltransferase